MEPDTQRGQVMDRYLSENGLLEAMDTWPKYGCKPDGRFIKLTKETEADYVPYVHYDDMVQAVTGTPVQDVAPVVHAHWEITKLTSKWIFVCSHCRYGWYESYEGEDIAWKYCPDCGAKMDEE